MRPLFPNPAADGLQVKVCGLTRLEDALLCASVGVNAIGVNFWPRGRRYHPLELAERWLPSVPESLARVAVLVNASTDEIERILDSGVIDVLQFHGDESPDFVRGYVERGIPCLRATALTEDADVEWVGALPVTGILLDTFAPGVYGGSGKTSDWSLAAQAVVRFPEKRFILCGGLSPENVAAAVSVVHPAAVDVASGVESAPGIKDEAKVRLLMDQLRGVR